MEFNRTLLFVTGKGGTGKSLLAAILGVLYAQGEKKVLLIDAESSGDLARQFEHSDVGYEPVEVMNNIFLLQCNTDDALAEYLNLNARIPTWAKITPLARFIDLVSHAAPGVKEILVTGKICYEVKKIDDGESDFDVVIVDAPSSGHIVSILDAPRALSEIISRGMIQTQTAWMQDILHDKEKTGVVVVTSSEDVVAAETRDLLDKIETNTEVEIAGVVLNRDITATDLDMKTPVVGGNLSVIDKTRLYYSTRVQRAKSVLHDFEKYPLFRFPLLSEMVINIRALTKNAERITRVNKDKGNK